MVLDTHVLLWLRRGDQRLGRKARREIDQAWRSDGVGVSAISFWEVAMLERKGRLSLKVPVGPWRREQLEQGIVEIPLDGEIGIRAVHLPDLHADPADRLIVATALDAHRLATADRRLLAWPGPLDRLDAAE